MTKAIEDKKKEMMYAICHQEKEDCIDDLESLIREDERNKVIDECITEVGLSYLPSNSDFGPEDMIELFHKLVALKDKQE